MRRGALNERIGRCVAALAAGVAGAVGGCGDEPPRPAGEGGWLTGGTQQKFETVAKNLRGLDVAMIEVDHRYGELYWAGQEQNWEYAAYQLDKIRLTLANALERRPKRAKSAQLFLDVMPVVKEAIDAKDAGRFEEAFASLTTACNACHALEQMGHLMVRTPEIRVTHVRRAPLASGGE